MSSLYETEPQDVADQPWFLNMAAQVQTGLSPYQLLLVLQAIECDSGRQRTDQQRRGPRTLDLDLLLFGDFVLTSDQLTIPHPRMLERRFVLEPLLEIAPDLRRPGTEENLSLYLARLQIQSQYIRLFKPQTTES